MKTLLINTAIAFLWFLFSNNLKSQDIAALPKMVGSGEFKGITPPLRDLPTLSNAEYAIMKEKADKKLLNKKLRVRSYPFADVASPMGADPIWQNTMGETRMSKAPVLNFDGQSSPYYPPDANGTAGPNHYMQTINTVYTIYNKSGALVAGPTNMNTLFSGVAGSNCNNGDPLILFDDQADRWLAVEFSLCGATDYMLVAVSTTNDPTGTWYKYSFDVDDMPDYEKFGIWQDGYYMGANNGSGKDIYVFERSQMLIGGAAPKMVGFDNPWRPTTIDGFLCVPPVDNDGAFAPAGSPGLFIAFNDDAISGGSDQLWIYELAVNWTNPASSTFNRSQQLAVPPFDSNFGNNWDNISQLGVSQKLDAIPQVIMNIPQYRNFGSYQTLVCCHTVDVDATNHAGVRWYELRRTSGAWSLRQSGTYAPDENSRWMGSIVLNGSGQLGLGYSVSSSTMYPAIRYCGQSSDAYASASGVMDIAEEIIQAGFNSQAVSNRWGDYSCMSVDPTDDQTFWFTSEYIGAGGSSKTKIAKFKFGNSPSVNTLAATAVTGTTATLNGIVDPNGLATTYHFEWGTTTIYGNSTTIASAGSGTSNINVSAGITGLTAGTTYHFRVVAVNSDGTTNGKDMTFIPGAAIVTTTPAGAILQTTATSGGNVTSDGGFTVFARGVCWSTSANPVVTGNHTTNGTGSGTFTSTIPGLSLNTTYHTRAYATNANGTFYGDDLTFTTLCGTYTLPLSESFSGATIPACWSQVDHKDKGQIWQFGTIAGQSPNPALTGSYAYLNSDNYGSGNSQNADLITPTFDLTYYSAVTLQFSHYFKSYYGSSGTISYSINGGSTWTQIQQFTATSATNPVTFNQNIPGVAGQSQVKFKWNYTGSWAYYWAIDNISVTGISTGLPEVTTTAVTSITATTATSGGNVKSAGTSGVTARGVCWSMSADPTVSGSHTNDGSGPGTFTGTITGLSPNTTFHVRAYATNSAGTVYGADISFTTACASISAFPWNEGFENGGLIPFCWSQEQVSNSGVNWTFNTGNGGSNPASAHGGYYNACLKDDSSPDNKTRLITPPLDLSGHLSPQLKFWHTQALWSPDQDQLAIYYKTSRSGTWTLIKTYTSNITSWTQETITLPDPTGEYFVAFEGNAKYGYGVCVDDVQVTSLCASVLPVSVSIAASANPEIEGDSVTFTATPANGGTTPAYQWKVNGSNVSVATNSTYSYVPANGDNITCVLTSNATCISGNPATSNTISMTMNPVPYVIVSVLNGGETCLQGSSHTIVWNDNIPDDIKIELFKGGVLLQPLAVSISAAGSWSWDIPTNQQPGSDYKVKITDVADSTVFDYSNADFTILAVGPSERTIQDVVVTDGQTVCYDATQTIYIAGNGTEFTVQGGGNATHIAGENIMYFPGTRVYEGGYMHGYITTNNQYCGSRAPSIVDAGTVGPEQVTANEQPEFIVYPNPTDGLFTLKFVTDQHPDKVEMALYTAHGNKILASAITGGEQKTFSLADRPVGVYIMHLMWETGQKTIKVIKRQ